MVRIFCNQTVLTVVQLGAYAEAAELYTVKG